MAPTPTVDPHLPPSATSDVPPPNIASSDPAAVAAHLRKAANDCILGYALANFDRRSVNFQFGVHNERVSKTKEINGILASFRKHGIRRVDPDTVIPIFVKKNRIRRLAANLDDELPRLELAPDDNDPIVVASGQHRTGAMEENAERLEQDLITVKKQIEDHQNRKKLRDVDRQDLAAKRIKQDELELELKSAFDWAIVAYDYGTCSSFPMYSSFPG